MNKLTTLSLLLSFSLNAFAQLGGNSLPATGTSKVSEKENGKIYGAVIDVETNQPVEFATIALMKAGTETPVDGTICDMEGKFTLNKIPFGTYDVVISFIGYETQTIKDVVLSSEKDEVSLGLVKLSTGSKILNEVVVEAQKAIIEERVDRTIYNAENDKTTRGGDAGDVLKRVPMLSVDMDGNVSMRGSSNVLVLINNKPSTIMASSVADALKQIPADQIKSVEVITSPSAKYDAEGSAGIINIITKKNTLEGLTLNINAGLGLRGSNLGLNGNYRKNKMGFSLGGWGRSTYNVSGRFKNSSSTLFPNDDPTIERTTTNYQVADTRNQGLFGNYTLGWDYDINEKNFITASVRLGGRNGNNFQDDMFTDNITTYTSGSTNQVTRLQDTESKDASNNVDASITYTHLYAKPQRELSFMGSFSRNNRTNNSLNLTREINGLESLSGFKNINDSYNEESTIQFDYQTPINSNQILEFGAKNIFRKVNSDFSTFQDPEGDGSYVEIINSGASNTLNYDQNVVAGYLAYTYSAKSGYSIKAGSRYEHTTINAYTKTESDIDIPAYGAFVPSINVSKKFSNGKTIKAAYNRRIQRPSIRYLNPNKQGNNREVEYSIGNPQLDPEFSNNYELSYSTFIKGTTLNFTGFWRNTNNSIQDIRNTVWDDEFGKDVIETSYKNIGQEDAIGLNLFANVNIGKLSLNGGSDIYYNILNNNLPLDSINRQYSAKNEGWIVTFRIFGSYDLSKGWTAQFFGMHRGNQIQLQGSRGGFTMYNLGLNKEFNNKKGSIGFAAENFLTNGITIKNELKSPLVNSSGSVTMRNMSFRINFSYRIGKMSMDSKPKRRRSINNDDLKEGGDNQMDSGEGNGGGGNQRGGGGGGFGGGGFGGGARGGFNGGGGIPNTGNATATQQPQTLAPVDTAAVVNAEGTWNYTLQSPQGGEGTLVIKKEGDAYTGTITNKRFNQETKLSSVTLNGNELSFSYEVSFGGNSMTTAAKTIITGDTLTGNMSVGQFGTFPINAKKTE